MFQQFLILMLHTVRSRLFSKQTFIFCAFVLLIASGTHYVGIGKESNPWQAWYDYTKEGEPLIFFFICALLYSSSVIRDEFENTTITYLFIRPIPKWVIALSKVAGASLLSMVPVLFYFLIHQLLLPIPLWSFILPLFYLQGTICCLFCFFSLMLPHPIMWGLVIYFVMNAYVPGAFKALSLQFHQQNIYGAVFRSLEISELTLPPLDPLVDYLPSFSYKAFGIIMGVSLVLLCTLIHLKEFRLGIVPEKK
jgi:hypothetical protein